MPVFDLKSTSNLLVALPELDLGNTDGIAQDTFIEQWVQQARLAVSAKGTVGAAVTEAVVAETSAQLTPTTFTVERPYVVRVLDTRTGWSLFLALISDPGA